MITKEQIYDFERTAVLIYEDSGLHVGKGHLEQLCRLALQALDMQPRPLSELDGQALIHWQGRWFVCWKQDNGLWVSAENGNPWSSTDKSYPLSSLPTPEQST